MDRNTKWFCDALKHLVALRKESVDRNIFADASKISKLVSLSARRAWIEILFALLLATRSYIVALRKESVDRNV